VKHALNYIDPVILINLIMITHKPVSLLDTFGGKKSFKSYRKYLVGYAGIFLGILIIILKIGLQEIWVSGCLLLGYPPTRLNVCSEHCEQSVNCCLCCLL